VQARRVVAVAFSGGRDSTALLRATLAAAQPLGIEVLALHVHHGLSMHADDWLAACEAVCARWARAGRPLRFVAHRLTTRPQRGDSIEAWARKARYHALREMALAHGASLVLLAHHRRDQAETLLLQALRGAGVAGLAGMPNVVNRDGITWARPWLGRPREDIEAYVRKHRLHLIEDDSNSDPRFARNRLRLHVWAPLTEAFPDAEATLADAAGWAQQALACVNELGAIDLATLARPTGIDIAAWLDLSPARRGNALRAWLKARCGGSAPASLVTRLLAEVTSRQSARWPMPGGELRSYRGVLSFKPGAGVAPPTSVPESTLQVLRAGRHALPGWGGALHLARVKEGGVPLAWLAQLALRPRVGGEQFQAGFGRPPRSLKKQYQAAAVPVWLRDGPLVYAGGQLVFVPGLGLDARVIGLPGQPQVTMRWQPLQQAI
jgi:tRNA(Ile)-lysidine synthase